MTPNTSSSAIAERGALWLRVKAARVRVCAGGGMAGGNQRDAWSSSLHG